MEEWLFLRGRDASLRSESPFGWRQISPSVTATNGVRFRPTGNASPREWTTWDFPRTEQPRHHLAHRFADEVVGFRVGIPRVAPLVG